MSDLVGWTERQLEILKIIGVPPDFFSASPDPGWLEALKAHEHIWSAFPELQKWIAQLGGGNQIIDNPVARGHHGATTSGA